MSRALGKDETIANVVIARVFLVARLASVWGWMRDKAPR